MQKASWPGKNNWNNYQSELRNYKKLLSKSKSNTVKEFCKNSESIRDTSRVNKILKSIGTKPTQLESIYKNKKTKCLTATPEETLDVMIRHHFTGDCEDVATEQNNTQQTSKTPTNRINQQNNK